MLTASLFTGIGGFEVGLSNVFPKAKHVAFAEYDKFASLVLSHRFPGVPNLGDITKIDWSQFPKCDILHASPPCQAFSVAGKQRGMEDERGLPMWNAYFACLEAVMPPIITLEEVPAVASKKFAKEWQWIQSEWARIGYHVKWTFIQALDCGVPQSRNRLIVVGFLDKAKCDAFEWPKPQPRTKKLKDVLQTEDEVDVKYYLKPEAVMKLLGKMTDEQVNRLLSLPAVNVPLKFTDRNGKQVNEYAGTVDTAQTNGVGVVNPFTGAEMEHARTIRTGGKQSLDDKPCVIIGDKALAIRRLTPVETMRLQGFPDDWNNCVSDSQRYKQAGNAVCTNVIEAVARQLKWIEDDEEVAKAVTVHLNA